MVVSVAKHNAPALRFGGFDGKWDTARMGDVAELNPSADIPNLFNYVDLASILGTELVSYCPYSKGKAPSRAQRVAQIGDIFYQTVRPYQKNNYHFNFQSDRAFVFSTGYAQIRPKINSSYVFTAVQRDEFLTQVLDRCTGTSYPAIVPSQVAEITLSFPESWKEQHAIGELFADLDALIEQHRAKHANLQQTKTALLQRMFPQDCADEPELRLDGFSGAWQPRIMRDCAEYSKGSGYSKKDITDEGTPVIHYGRLYTNYETVITSVDTFASPQPGALISRGDEVLVPASGETAEDIAIASALLQPGVLIGGDLNVIRPRRNIDPVFLALNLSNGVAKETLVKRAQGKSVVHLRNSDIQDIEIFFPTLEEQHAIGEVFFNLDALIAAESCYITQLTQAKTALLQRMFV